MAGRIKYCPDYEKAVELGKMHYFTGRPCDRGHVCKRYTSTRQCMECQKARSNTYSRTDKAKLRAKERHLKTKYDVDLEFVRSFKSCEICDVDMTDCRGATGRCVDHDHETGKVRGVLCNHCNRALGLLSDSSERLQKAMDYLNKYSDKLVPLEWLEE